MIGRLVSLVAAGAVAAGAGQRGAHGALRTLTCEPPRTIRRLPRAPRCVRVLRFASRLLPPLRCLARSSRARAICSSRHQVRPNVPPRSCPLHSTPSTHVTRRLPADQSFPDHFVSAPSARAGYGLVLLCNVATAVYLTAIGRIGRRTGLNSFGLMWLNGVLCAPVLFGYTALSGKLRLALDFPEMSGFGFRAVLGLSCVLAFALNYTIFLNTAVNSALTQTVCGSIKDVLVVGLGFRSFGGVPFDPLNSLGIALGFAGSALYAHCRLTGAGGGMQPAQAGKGAAGTGGGKAG